MKKLLTALFVLLSFGLALAGEVRTTPSTIELTSPNTNQVEFISLEFLYGSNPVAVLKFNVLDSSGRVYKSHKVLIQNELDDPNTDVLDCTASGVPYTCCTGAGTGDCDESTTDFSDFISGVGATLYTRSDARVWAYITSHYTIQ